MKKILLTLFALVSASALAAEDIHVYGKIGADVYSRYNKIQLQSGEFSTFGKANGFSGFLEVTGDVSPNVELGLGLGYVHRSSGKTKKSGDQSWKTPKYHTIPLYALGKYNFDSGNEWKPYVKVDLGMAFNDASPTLEFDWGGLLAGQKKDKLDVKNGFYTGVGVGAEYNNFLAELSYHITTAKAKGTYGYTTAGNQKTVSFENSYNNHAITLSVGYKFNF